MQITDALPSAQPGIIEILATDFFLFFVVVGVFIYALHRRSQTQKDLDISSMKLNLTALTTILLLIAMFAPSNLNFYPEPGTSDFTHLIAMSWDVVGFSIRGAMVGFVYFLVGLPFMFLRLVFVYQVYKYYLGITTRKRVVIAGILGEVQFALISLALLPVCYINPNLAAIISIPIPILLLVGLMILRFVPRAARISEWTELEDKDWWEKEKEETSDSDNA